jgi:alanine racemase
MTSWSRSTTVTIDLAALRENFQTIRQGLNPDQQILSVVKSNAYGHGSVEVARVLIEEGSEWLGVGTIDEGINLRTAGIEKPILILLGDIRGGFEELLHHQLTPVVQHQATLQDLSQWLKTHNKSCSVHLKVDTGMTRLGFLPEQLPAALFLIKETGNIAVEGILSHLIDATDSQRTHSQQKVFEECLSLLKQQGVQPQWRHLANSIATAENQFPQYNLTRPGMILYGVAPFKPVMSWQTQVLNVKDVPAGTTVSYNATFTAKNPSRIAVLPVGYADGYPRLLSNRASVLIRGQRAPVVGIVCMDLTMIDVTHIPAVQVGDTVTLLGSDGEENITVEDMAEWAETIPYEIVTRVATRVPRQYRDKT